MSLTYGELFAGYDGLGMGVRSVLGGRTLWHAENDAAPSKILKFHDPAVPNLGDVTKVDWSAVPKVDVLTGGYPCQPFSHAGKRAGTDDDRHLWPYVETAISVLRPGLCVFENVRGHLSLGFDEVMDGLDALAYDVRWYMLRASDVGAPHGRARIFIFAEDRYGRQLHGRNYGLGRVHPTVPEPTRRGDGADGSEHDLQSTSVVEPDSREVRREVHRRETRPEADSGGYSCVAADRSPLSADTGAASTVSPAQASAGGFGDLVSGAGGLDAARQGQGWPLDGRTQGSGCPGSLSDEGAEQEGTGTSGHSWPAAVCDPGGRALGEPADVTESVAGPLRGTVAGVRADGEWVGVPVVSGCERAGLPVFAHPAGDPWRFGHGDDGTAVDAAGQRGGALWADQGGSQRADGVGRGGQWSRVAADADRVGHERAGAAWGWGSGLTDDRLPPADAGVQRHGRRQDRAGLGRVDGHDAGEARQRQRSREVLGDRGAEAAPDAHGAGRIEHRRPEPVGPELIAAQHDRDAAAHAPVDWGQYAPAIARWKSILGRPAPAPTEPGPKGGQRLSPAFVEFLMGLDEGHVTDPAIGISRNDQLKVLGNGVVPQQAAAATRAWVTDVSRDAVA